MSKQALSKIVEIEITPGQSIARDDRVWIVKNFDKQSIKEFDTLFQQLQQQQNSEPEYVETMGPVVFESLPITAMKRVQTPEEKRLKRLESSRKRNRKPEVIAKKKARENTPEQIAKRYEYNRLPRVKKGKDLSNKKRRRALRFVQQNHPEIYQVAEAWGKSKLAKEEEEQMSVEEDSHFEEDNLEGDSVLE